MGHWLGAYQLGYTGYWVVPGHLSVFISVLGFPAFIITFNIFIQILENKLGSFSCMENYSLSCLSTIIFSVKWGNLFQPGYLAYETQRSTSSHLHQYLGQSIHQSNMCVGDPRVVLMLTELMPYPLSISSVPKNKNQICSSFYFYSRTRVKTHDLVCTGQALSHWTVSSTPSLIFSASKGSVIK